jgi:hypothetical protein
LADEFHAFQLNIRNCTSGVTSVQVSRKFKVFESQILYNVANFGGFATFKMAKKIKERIEFDLGANTRIEGNHARIAGGKFFLIEPVDIYVPKTDTPAVIATKTCTRTHDKNGNSASCYGPEVAGTTTNFDTHYPRFIYPEEVFPVTVRRYDRFGQYVNREVDPKADTSRTILRIVDGSLEGNSTFQEGEVVYQISLSTRRDLETTSLMFSATKYHVEPVIFNVTISPVCPPGFQLVWFYFFFPVDACVFFL